MTKGSESSGNSASKVVARCGYAEVVPANTTARYAGAGARSYETKSQVSYSDKQTGSYGRETTTEKASAGAFQWKNGTTGTRTEYKESSTVRVGDKGGYTEVYSEHRVRDVVYDRSNTSSGGNNYVTYNNNGGGGSYGGYGYDSQYSYNNDVGGSYGGNGYDSQSYNSDAGGSYGDYGNDSHSYDNGHGGSYGGYGYDSRY